MRERSTDPLPEGHLHKAKEHLSDTNFTIVFIHGYIASHTADWYPKIGSELENLGVDFRMPDLPGGEFPQAKEWLETLNDVISTIDKPLVLVGHSLGTRAALLYLEKYQRKTERVVLISTYRNSDNIENVKPERKDKYGNFFDHNIDIEKIKTLSRFIIMHSRDDDFIPYEQGVEMAEELEAELITYTDRGHFSNPDNASFVLDVLRNQLQF